MPTTLKYLLLIPIGFALVWLCSLVQQVHSVQQGEYQYSSFLRNNYTVLTAIVFFIAGFIAGYFVKYNPWYGGLCIVLVFPLVSVYEATVYNGSHNLLPFELLIYFLYALPAVAGLYAGNFIFTRSKIRN